MNPTDIANALDALGRRPFEPATFAFDFAEATDSPQATLAKLRNGSANKSDLTDGALLSRKFHFLPAKPGGTRAALDLLRDSRKNRTARPAILIATDGEMIAAEHLASGERLDCAYGDLGSRFAFFLPAAGKAPYRAAEENPVDIRATGRLANLYDALLKANPSWRSKDRRHDMNLFMTRLIFCLFAEDVEVFPANQFSSALFNYGGDRGEHARQMLIHAFTALSRPRDERGDLPAWAGPLEYVNGGLFRDAVDAPDFDPISFKYLREAAGMDWREINPDIFGSMIQSIADVDARAELGMHYTSVPNIMKVLGPLFLDDLDAEIAKAWDRPSALRTQLDRLSRIRIFDPACGSGNFLVIAYREMRERELTILTRLGVLSSRPTSMTLFSSISLSQFYGIEISDFAAETAKLALFIAEYQANTRMRDQFGPMPPLLPLREGGAIVCRNALEVDWEEVCPPPNDGSEVFIAGNPPYLGGKKREPWQTADMVRNGLKDVLLLDYVSTWFFKAARYGHGSAPFAFVATSSICQGEQVAPLWTRLLTDGLQIDFAYTPFTWRNSAADVAGVWVTIVGLSRRGLSEVKHYDAAMVSSGQRISPYLYLGEFIPVEAAVSGEFGLPDMVMGSNPVDGKRLVVTPDERESMIRADPAAEAFIKLYLGGDELLEGRRRYCVWVENEDLEAAMAITAIRDRIEACATYRLSAGRDARKVAHRAHSFCYTTYSPSPALAIPNTQSSARLYIPATFTDEGVVLSKEAFAVYDAPQWLLAVTASKLHRLWLATVGGRIGNGFRYSVRLVYNTFPTPTFTAEQRTALAASARRILRARYQQHPKTLAALYSQDMDDELRAAHEANDLLLEQMYVDRPFRNDTERLATLFKRYAARPSRQR